MFADKEYIEMCTHPKLQKKWKIHTGDYIYWPDQDVIDIFTDIDTRLIKNKSKIKKKGGIWIPRLDQLALLIKGWDKERSQSFFSHVFCNSTSFGEKLDKYGRWFADSDSLEKHLLKIIAFQQWRRKWNSQKEKWENINK